MVDVVVFWGADGRDSRRGVSCPRDPSQITRFSPEGLAPRSSIRINGNYCARERDEWAAGRETSSFVVLPPFNPPPGVFQSCAHTHTHTHKH